MQLDPFSLALYCLFFMLFFLKGIQGKGKWRQRGMITGFIVALFTEMWGFPLSLFVISVLAGDGGLPYQFDNLWYFFTQPRIPGDVAFTNMPLAFFAEYAVARGITLLSILPIIYGWFTLKRNLDKGLVRIGPYVYSRNPQYIGFILFIVGMVLYWPTLITIPMGCVLSVAYIKLALKEENELKQRFKGTYQAYFQEVPRFVGKDFQKIFRLPKGLSFSEKMVEAALLLPFVLWFSESVLGLVAGEAFVRAHWLPIAYVVPIHIGVVVSIAVLLASGVLALAKKQDFQRKSGKGSL
jgi:protein-S-isoprenylcysteine O-methyltransferase Ste14